MKIAATAVVLVLGSGVGAVQAQSSFNLEETVAVCTTCHGEDGVPVSTDIPILAGQQFYYLYVQLKDFQAGRRASDVMQPLVEPLDKEQMKALAQHFAEKPWPNVKATKDPEVSARAQTAIADGQCTACHNTFMGDSRVPRVAGQQADYTEKTLLDLKHDIRANAAAMQSLMHSFSDEDISAIAHYLAAL